MKFSLKILQGFSVALMVVMILLFVFTVLGSFSWNMFFLSAALIALIAHVIIPRVRTTLTK